VPFDIQAPAADSIGVDDTTLPTGTTVAVTLVRIYDACHVYYGRILTGDARNAHLLLVVPSTSGKVASMNELQHADAEYITPVATPTTKPAKELAE
jgi:hypothetical protein